MGISHDAGFADVPEARFNKDMPAGFIPLVEGMFIPGIFMPGVWS